MRVTIDNAIASNSAISDAMAEFTSLGIRDQGSRIRDRGSGDSNRAGVGIATCRHNRRWLAAAEQSGAGFWAKWSGADAVLRGARAVLPCSGSARAASGR